MEQTTRARRIRLLGRLVKSLNELFVFFVREFRRSALSWFVVDNLLERLVSEPFESGEPFRGPTAKKPVECGGVCLR